MLPFVLLGIGIDDTFVLMQGLALYPPCTKVRVRVTVRVRLRLRLRLRLRVSLTLTLTLNPNPIPNPSPNLNPGGGRCGSVRADHAPRPPRLARALWGVQGDMGEI